MEYYNSDTINIKKTFYENPDNVVYMRGKILDSESIQLPEEWENTIDPKSITISLIPCGTSQNIAIKTVGTKEVCIQFHNGIPIEYYYLIMAEIIDKEEEEKATTDQ